MARISAVILFLISQISAPAGIAKEAAEEPLEIGASGEAYMSAIWGRGVDTMVRYFDPTRPAPSLDTREQPEPPKETDDAVEGENTARNLTTLVSVVVLGGIVLLVARNAGGISLAFGSNENATRNGGSRSGKPGAHDPRDPADLASIIAISDRRRAIIALAQSALAKAATAQGMLLQRSWTGRDVLHRVRSGTQHFSALRAVVLASERVHFGRRDISDDEFVGHVDGLRPLFAEPAK